MELAREERAVLCSLYNKCSPTTHCHLPGEYIVKALPRHARGHGWKALEKLRRRGLIYQKGGTDSYGLTREGINMAREICRED